ncbi:MAG: SLC13 family permease [Magnetococcales bacterium]|nr:SLC13 family permease [Magnetococcales bacterium]
MTNTEQAQEEGSKLVRKKIIQAVVFAALGVFAAIWAPSLEIACVTSILLLTIYLFVSEIVGVDVAGISIMVLLGLFGMIGPWIGLATPLVPPNLLFSGFSSNAVISIIAVMIIGASLDKTGLMTKTAGFIMRVGGRTEQRVIPSVSATVAFISSFMQNVGAAALFLPVVSRISVATGLPLSRLLMPMGFCAILGGTVTMVGSSPLILLNDLILTSNKVLPPDKQMEIWSLFTVTPIGLALVATGIIYFVLAGKYVLPVSERRDAAAAGDTLTYFRSVYGLDYDMFEVKVPVDSRLAGKTLDETEHTEKIRVVAIRAPGDNIHIGEGMLHRDRTIEGGSSMAIFASPDNLKSFCERYQLESGPVEEFAEVLSTSKSGIAEVVIPPGSKFIGQSARDVWMRKTYGLAVVGLYRQGKTMKEGEGIRTVPLQSGDALVVHTTWKDLHKLTTNRDFLVVTTGYPHEDLRPHKVNWALLFFAIALGLILFSSLKLSVSLFVGALGMILAGVLSIEEAYRAVSWKSVFLLASLIPLGTAVETSGTAAWVANSILTTLHGIPVWGMQAVIAILATCFTLVMSNVGATVLLVPLAVNIAVQSGANPAVFALTVALATSNSFFIPTHQVNALLMGPGGYRVADYMRAGGIMTLLFLVVLLVMLNIVF